ncbi:MAG: hypothetical protein ACLGGX_06320 [Bdellovibrionia bacterium]
MSIDPEIVKEFVVESKTLIEDLIELLESIDGDFSKVEQLADYGNRIDRIMGGAKSLALLVDESHALHLISDYTALCKAVGYKASQIKDNESFFDICVALLLDATESLEQMMDHLDMSAVELKKRIPVTFIERVRFISNQFSEDMRGSVDARGTQQGKMSQTDIDELMRKLGL